MLGVWDRPYHMKSDSTKQVRHCIPTQSDHDSAISHLKNLQLLFSFLSHSPITVSIVVEYFIWYFLKLAHLIKMFYVGWSTSNLSVVAKNLIRYSFVKHSIKSWVVFAQCEWGGTLSYGRWGYTTKPLRAAIPRLYASAVWVWVAVSKIYSHKS